MFKLMDFIVFSLLSIIFLISILLLQTRKKIIKIYRRYILTFLLFILVIVLSLAIYDIFVNKKNEQFGGGNKRNKLMEKCGLPLNYRATSHCFSDSTHHTCCMLGPKARKYADSTGNPIGKASKKAFKKFKKQQKQNSKITKDEATPWCTCFGSEVCSFYAKKFNDGTHIKFVNDPQNSTNIADKPSSDCEGYFRDKFQVKSHGTPGVNKVGNVNVNCRSEDSKIKSIFK